MWTPWGKVQNSKKIAPGIMFYGTASHGGFHVSKKKNISMPDCLRIESGWYEEDCEWARVVIAFPYIQSDYELAKKTLANWAPESYEAYFHTILLPGTSYMKDKATFEEENKENFVAVSAWGDHAMGVPSGFVAVRATKGGKRDYGVEEQYFLVPKDKYIYGTFGYVIDPITDSKFDKTLLH